MAGEPTFCSARPHANHTQCVGDFVPLCPSPDAPRAVCVNRATPPLCQEEADEEEACMKTSVRGFRLRVRVWPSWRSC